MKVKGWKRMEGGASAGAVYCTGFIGAAIYFLQHATGIGDGLIGIIKAIFWPGVLVYRALEILKI